MKKTRMYKRLKNFRIQSTVTGKRQITIPKEIYDYFELNNGDHISFIETDGQIIFEPTDYRIPCFACEGVGKIMEQGCFICCEEGKIDKIILEDTMRFLSFIGFNAFQYRVSIGYECLTVPFEEGERYLPYPVVILDSKEHDSDRLKWIRDYLQSIIIEKEVQKDIAKAYLYRETYQKGVELSLYLDEEREQISSWLKEVFDTFAKEHALT